MVGLLYLRSNIAFMDKQTTGIELSLLKELQQGLKALNQQWVPLLVKQIQEDESIEEQYRQVNERKVYNIFNGIVTDGAWKLVVFREAKKLKESLQKAVEEAINS